MANNSSYVRRKRRISPFWVGGYHPFSALRHVWLCLHLLDDRYDEKSVIITSQLPLDRWYDYIAEPTLADAIMDRLINSSEHIELKGETLRHNRRRR